MRRALAPLAFAAIISVTVVFLALASVSAQELRGSLFVLVADSSGAAIPSANVTVSDEKSAPHFSVLTNLRGEAILPALAPATYSVEVSAKGFAPRAQRVVISISSQSSLRFTLAVASARDSVVITLDYDLPPPPDMSSSTVQSVITSADLDEIPLSARSFANISLMAPFTAPVEPSDPTKARITAVSFGGSSGLNIDFSVDGGDNNDDFIGGFLQNYSPEAMQEFVVRSAQFGSD